MNEDDTMQPTKAEAGVCCYVQLMCLKLPGFHAPCLASSAGRLHSAAAPWTQLSALLHTQ